MNALTVDMALGCSDKQQCFIFRQLHMRQGLRSTLILPMRLSAKTPNLCHLAPAGHTYMEELNEAGGIYAVMNELNKKGLLYI